MNATTAALVWCAIQVTVLTCGVTLVYLAARRVHPRAGAAAAGGGLVMVIALTLLAASPWPRWNFHAATASKAGPGPDTDVAPNNISGDMRNDAPQHETMNGPAPTLVEKSVVSGPSYWSFFVDAIQRSRGFVSVGDETFANPQAAWLPRIVVVLFVVGGVVAAARLAWSVASVRRLTRSGRPVYESRLEAIMNELRQRLELTGTVAVRESDQLATPATVGWRRPVVLLPAAWREWSDADLRAVIAHELAHIAGRDYAAWFVARLAVVAHFYHPLVRWLATRLQLEQELAADMTAARLVGDPKQYLHSLAALALAMPPHRMAGPARTLFPSRSLLVRRVEMLRANDVSRPRRGTARYATFATVALVGLAAAGLRGPGVDLAASALAQAPPATKAPSNEAAKTEAAGPVERIGLEVVPPDAAYVLSVRPAEIAAREELRVLLESFGDVRRMLAEASIEIADIAEVMAMQYGKLAQAPQANVRIVVRFVTPANQKKFIDWHVKELDMKKSPDAAVWKSKTRHRITELDGLTLVLDEVATPGETPAALLKNKLPEWADAWAERKEHPAVFALNVGTAWQSLGGNADPVQMFGEAAMQTLYPLITDVSWAVAHVELKEKIRVGGVVQAKDDESTETVRETLQAAAVLLRNMARLYTNAQPQGPDGNPAPEAQSRLQKFVAGEVDRLFGSAKFETNGGRVEASLQSTLSTAKLAEVIKLALPSVEEARGAARRAQSMNNLKNLQLAMLNYEAAYRVLPAAASFSYRAKGEARKSEHPHSWRIDLLPFLEQQALYDQYHFDEPWDSEANKKVLAQMPELFRSPHDGDPRSTNTSYFVLTGPDTVFPDGESARVAQIRDGASSTISVVESKRPVLWTKPEDIEYSADKPLPELGGWVPGEILVAFVDGSVRPIPVDADEQTLRALITKAGREIIPNKLAPR